MGRRRMEPNKQAKCKIQEHELRLMKEGFTDMTNQLLKGLKILNDVNKNKTVKIVKAVKTK